jgi:murein DD-endopeptidase MepM/ murein hydrolase activator NlpD
VIVDHGYGIYALYAHLSEQYVSVGDVVIQGQVLGAAGSTGRSVGPHLHYELIIHGNNVDPIKWLALVPGFVEPQEILYHNQGIPESESGP